MELYSDQTDVEAAGRQAAVPTTCPMQMSATSTLLQACDARNGRAWKA